MQKIAQHHKQIYTHTNMQMLSSTFYFKQNSKQIVLFKYASDSLLGSALGGVFPKFFLKTMLWKYLFKSMEELTVSVNFRFLVHHSHPTRMLLTVVLIIAVRGWISHERWYVGKGEVLQLCFTMSTVLSPSLQKWD